MFLIATDYMSHRFIYIMKISLRVQNPSKMYSTPKLQNHKVNKLYTLTCKEIWTSTDFVRYPFSIKNETNKVLKIT